MKIIKYILILIVLFNCFSTTINVQAQTENYVFLAPITDEFKNEGFNPSDPNALSKYLNIMIKVIIGIAAVLAVVMIVVGGMEYMTSELISSKEQGKTRITEALLGLIVALSAYALLNTINPDLLNIETKNLEKITVEGKLDESNYAKTEQSTLTAGKGFKLNGSTSNGVTKFISDKLSKGAPLRAIKVDTRNNVAYFYVGAEGDWSQFVSIPINKGLNGVSEIGQGKAGDAKTPKGTFTITGDRRIPGNGVAVLSNDGGYNLGAAFINIGVGNRGIGFHGSANNSLGTTNGCIRMSNDDLIALAPYMKAGVRVIIE